MGQIAAARRSREPCDSTQLENRLFGCLPESPGRREPRTQSVEGPGAAAVGEYDLQPIAHFDGDGTSGPATAGRDRHFVRRWAEVPGSRCRRAEPRLQGFV